MCACVVGPLRLGASASCWSPTARHFTRILGPGRAMLETARDRSRPLETARDSWDPSRPAETARDARRPPEITRSIPALARLVRWPLAASGVLALTKIRSKEPEPC